MKKLILFSGIALIAAVLFSCNTRMEDTVKQSISELPARETQVSGKEPWQIEWEKWLAAAKKEGKVVVMGTPGGAPVRQAISDGFKSKYDIQAEIIEAGVGLIQQKVLAERRAGVYTSDLYIGGTSTILGDLKPAGIFESLEPVLVLPEVTKPDVWWRGKLDYLDKEKITLAFQSSVTVPWAINTDVMKQQDEPKIWKDLLESRWRGKIIMGDPRITGNASTNFMVMSYYGLGLDYWKELNKQEPLIIRDQRQQVEWLAQGKFSILISPQTATMTEFIKAGAPVKHLIPVSEFAAISSASGNVALMNNSPHPNAARIFVNWLLSKEGQTIISTTTGYQSGRVDVPTAFLDPLKVRQPGVKYIATYTEEFLARRDQARKDAQDIFGR